MLDSSLAVSLSVKYLFKIQNLTVFWKKMLWHCTKKSDEIIIVIDFGFKVANLWSTDCS